MKWSICNLIWHWDLYREQALDWQAVSLDRLRAIIIMVNNPMINNRTLIRLADSGTRTLEQLGQILTSASFGRRYKEESQKTLKWKRHFPLKFATVAVVILVIAPSDTARSDNKTNLRMLGVKLNLFLCQRDRKGMSPLILSTRGSQGNELGRFSGQRKHCWAWL